MNEQVTRDDLVAMMAGTVRVAKAVAGPEGEIAAVLATVRTVCGTYGIRLTQQDEVDVLVAMDDAPDAVDALLDWINGRKRMN